MTKPDTSYVAKVVIDAYDSGTDKYSALAEVVRSIADELGYHLFLPGDDCRVIDASIVYDVANKLEMMKTND